MVGYHASTDVSSYWCRFLDLKLLFINVFSGRAPYTAPIDNKAKGRNR